MKKKVCIVSLYANNNFGNKLQNYAIQKKCTDLGFDSKILRNSTSRYKKIKFKSGFKVIAKIKNIIYRNILNKDYKNLNFKNFETEYLKVSKNHTYYQLNNNKLTKEYDYFIVGSDQVWNPNFGLKGDLAFLEFVKNKPRIAFSASFGVDKIEKTMYSKYANGLNNLDYISVRENAGKKITEELTNRTDIEVLIDPTMLLTKKEWEKVEKKPKKLKSNKYILNYFLGELSEERKKEIERIAKENNCDIINILDKNDPLYDSGPSEFLYLEKNAFLICTDSFHSSVFAILYDRPFIIFKREQKNMNNMFSRLDTLLTTFKIKNRIYNNKKITKENLEHDYSEAYKILEKERNKSKEFLEKALDIK